MTLTLRPYRSEGDFWRVRRFLQEVFLLNDRREHSWHVSRWDFLRWHIIENCHICGPLEATVTLWEAQDGALAAVLNPIETDEAFIHIHPAFRTPELEAEIIQQAERTFKNRLANGTRRLYVPVDEDDLLRKQVLARLGYTGRGNPGWEHWHDLGPEPLPAAPVPPGFTLRSMGGPEEHPARNWCSWLAYHPDEPPENFDPDASWYLNVQRCPLYRRDLDVIAVDGEGAVAAFVTCLYDDHTQSAVTKLVGTAAPFWRRGLGRALMSEAMRRLQSLGCTRLIAKATDPQADRFYDAVMDHKYTSETWIRDYKD